MNSLNDVFRLLLNAESAIRRAGWSPDDYSLPHEIRHIAARHGAGDFQKARAHLKGRQVAGGSPVKLPDRAQYCSEDYDRIYDEFAEALAAAGHTLVGQDSAQFGKAVATKPPAPCAMPDDVKAALADLDASFYRVWAKNRQELTGYVAGNVKPVHLVKVIEWARQNSTAPAPRITEQDAREIATDFDSWNCGQNYLGSYSEWYEKEGRALLNKLNIKEG
jgi:hypothetical protein